MWSCTKTTEALKNESLPGVYICSKCPSHIKGGLKHSFKKATAEFSLVLGIAKTVFGSTLCLSNIASPLVPLVREFAPQTKSEMISEHVRSSLISPEKDDQQFPKTRTPPLALIHTFQHICILDLKIHM